MEDLRTGTNAFQYAWRPVTSTLKTRKFSACTLCMWHYLHCAPVLITGLSIIPDLRRPQTASRSFPTEGLTSSVLLSCPPGHIYGLRCGGTDPWVSPANGRDTSPQELVMTLPYQCNTFKLTSGWHHISHQPLLTKATVLQYFGFITLFHNERVIFLSEQVKNHHYWHFLTSVEIWKLFSLKDTSPQTTLGLTFVVSSFCCGFWRCCRSCRAGEAMELGGGAHGACAYRLCSFYFCFWVGSQQLVSIPIWMCLSQSLALFLCNTVTLRYSGTLLLTMAEMHSWRLERGCFSVQGHMFEWFQLGNPLSLVVWWSRGLLTFIKLCHPLQYDCLPLVTHIPLHTAYPCDLGLHPCFSRVWAGRAVYKQWWQREGRKQSYPRMTAGFTQAPVDALRNPTWFFERRFVTSLIPNNPRCWNGMQTSSTVILLFCCSSK